MAMKLQAMKKITAYVLATAMVAGLGMTVLPETVQAAEARPVETLQNNRCFINGNEVRAYQVDKKVYVVVDDLSYYGFAVKKDAGKVDITWAGSEYKFVPGVSPTTDTAIMSSATKTTASKGTVDGKEVTYYTVGGKLCVLADDLGAFGYTNYDSDRNIMNIYVEEAGYAEDSTYRNIVVDASKSVGKITSFQGGHWDPQEAGSTRSNSYKEIGVDMIRTHDLGVDNIFELVPGYFEEIIGISTHPWTGQPVESVVGYKFNTDIDLTDLSNYDFSGLDAAIENIVDVDADVFFRFGNGMGEFEDLPDDNTPEWNEVVQDMGEIAQQIVKRYEGKIDYFEIWNEPDLVDFWPFTTDQYYDLYAEVSKAVKEVDPDLPVGGPALTTQNNDTGIRESFMKFVADNNLPLDFFSYHYYPSLNRDPYDYTRWAYELDAELEKYGLGDVPLIMSEFGTQIFMSNPFPYASTQQGTYLAAILMYLQDSPTVKANYYEDLVSKRDGSITTLGYAFKAVSKMNDTPNRLAVSGTDKNGFAVLAGQDADGDQINVLINNYVVPNDCMISNSESGNPMIVDNKMQIPNVANWSLPIARLLTYENNEGYNLTVADVPFGTKDVVVELYRLDADNNLDKISSETVYLNEDGSLTLSNELSAYELELVTIKAGTEPADKPSDDTTTPGDDTTTPGGDTTTPGGDTTTPGGTTPNKPADTTSPKTGDVNANAAWVLLLGGCVAIAAVLGKKRTLA